MQERSQKYYRNLSEEKIEEKKEKKEKRNEYMKNYYYKR